MIQLHLHRHRIRTITCDGTLSIDGTHICDTAENTPFRAPAGTYRIVLQHSKRFGRKVPALMPLLPAPDEAHAPSAVLAIGNGIFHRNDSRILLGTYIAPGCLMRSRAPFMQLYDRINHSLRRGHDVTLLITEEGAPKSIRH